MSNLDFGRRAARGNAVVEPMECRRLFAVGVVDDNPHPEDKPNKPDVPEVTAVFVASTQWSGGFRQYLQDAHLGSAQLGYEVDNGNDSVPWTNINQISIQFDSPAAVDSGDLDIILTRPSHSKEDGASDHAHISAFSLSADKLTATWTLEDPITRPAEVDLRILDRDIIPTGSDQDDSTPDDKPNNKAFDFDFDVLPGDVNRDGVVNATDVVRTRNRLGRSVLSTGDERNAYSPFADVDGSGVINATDLVLVRNNLGSRLHGHNGNDD